MRAAHPHQRHSLDDPLLALLLSIAASTITFLVITPENTTALMTAAAAAPLGLSLTFFRAREQTRSHEERA
jgi:hypothetical protein